MSARVLVVRDFEQMSNEAAELAIGRIRLLEEQKAEVVLGLATGNSPTGLYSRLADAANSGAIDSRKWRTFNLDEYIGLPGSSAEERRNDPNSYWSFMRERLFSRLTHLPVKISVPPGELVDVGVLWSELKANPADWHYEGTSRGRAVVLEQNVASQYLRWVKEHVLTPYVHEIGKFGGVDFQLLGIGGHGHVAFHEAGIPFRLPGLLLVELDEVTRQHAVEDGNFSSLEQCPRFALTMSVELVFQARSVLVLANGERKVEAVRRSLLDDPAAEMPMSYVQIYARRGGDITFIMDAVAAQGLLAADRDELDRRGVTLQDLR